jgi:type IX secretion system PorP/SprF family membrane protein
MKNNSVKYQLQSSGVKPQVRRATQVVCSLVLAVCSLPFTNSVQAQQDPLYGLYNNNPLVINPAFAGMTNNLNVNVGYRYQWAGFDGSPTTLNATGSISLLQNKIGAGLQIVQDNIGENKNTSMNGLFAYKLNFENRVISFGMSAGVVNFKVDPSKVNLQNPDDPSFATISEIKPTLGVGVMIKSNKYLIGLSVPRLLSSSFNTGVQNIQVYQPHFYVFGSYLFFVSERIVLKPTLLLKGTQGSPFSTDVNFNVIIDRNYSVGAYTRNLNAIGLLAQINFLEKFRVAYAFEVPTNNSVGTRYTTNEIMIGIRTAVFSSHDMSQSNF